MPGAEGMFGQFLTTYQKSRVSWLAMELIQGNIQPCMVKPRDEFPRDAQLDPHLCRRRFPADFFPQFASQAFLRSFTRFTSSAKTGELTCRESGVRRPRLQQQPSLGVFQNGTDVLGPLIHVKCGGKAAGLEYKS